MHRRISIYERKNLLFFFQEILGILDMQLRKKDPPIHSSYIVYQNYESFKLEKLCNGFSEAW